MASLLPIAILFSLSIGLSLWGVFGLGGLIATTSSMAAFCQDLLTRCLELPALAMLLFFWAGAALLGAGFVYAVVKNGYGLISSALALRRLPTRDWSKRELSKRTRGAVVLIEDTESMAAFTHGLFHPRIYLSRGLVERLTKEELRGVYRHELHHKRRYDPARFLLYNLVADTFCFIPVIGHLTSELIEQAEYRADAEAAVTEAERLDLAGAMVKVARSNRTQLSLTSAYLTGRAGKKRTAKAVESRLLFLVEGLRPKRPAPRLRTKALSVAVAALITLSLVGAYTTTSVAAVPECNMEHCKVHSSNLDAECRTHCDLSSDLSGDKSSVRPDGSSGHMPTHSR
ncbi:MAG: M56 family metallopeptidase [Proteobacteria bacterium]|nr:M56 family metallopeptidase [Pseudomonadota bacterium]